ncbi:MAG: MBL fold metallo-hydrolase [Acidobacteria bacterium]|nr:MBL fold metallo-hydrolase [Acidobacteriota bacterium]
MQLRFLGTGDAFGSGGRFQTCLYVHGSNGSFLIDCGSSSLIAMKRFGINPSQIGWVFLTHLHGDHFGGVPFLILDGQFNRRDRSLVIAGPLGVRARVEAAMEILFPGSSRVRQRFPVDFAEFQERTSSPIGPATITPFAVAHASGASSYALRVEYAGKVITYSGDTEWTNSLVDAARGADVFICEAYSYEKKLKYHLDYRALQNHRSQIECSRIILTHMSADMLAHTAQAEFECAEDGQTIVI